MVRSTAYLLAQCFNTQPPVKHAVGNLCFNTQPPEGGWTQGSKPITVKNSFNTQPPEGGWQAAALPRRVARGFNTQPPEGGWAMARRDIKKN